MDTLIAGFFFVSLLLCVLYLFLMTLLSAGWISLKRFNAVSKAGSTRVSILIAARNEEKNIAACIDSILAQNYPQQLVQLIIINDASSDNTAAEVNKVLSYYPHVNSTLINLEEPAGKKGALVRAMEIANAPLIFTTDADTVRGSAWLSSMVSFYEANKPRMIIGPVGFTDEKSWFGKMQSIEFMGLVATGGASSRLGYPLVCNGANLAFEREAFDAVSGYSGTGKVASGDDVMLMSRIHKRFPGSVMFLRSREAFVYTQLCNDLRSFVHQRIRWASKNRAGYSLGALAAGGLVLAFNFALLAGLILSIPYPELLLPVGFLLVVKCFIDFLFLFLAATFFKKQRLLLLFVPEQLLYILYVNTIGILSMFRGYEWKGRKHR